MFDIDDKAVHKQYIEKVCLASVNSGVMHIVWHGTLAELIDRLREAGKWFFDLLLEEMDKYAND